MQALGNDFVVIDGVRQSVPLTSTGARRLADRHFGVGCDQVLMVEAEPSAGADFRYRIWNADGGEVAQCGNGARCLAKFVTENGLSDKKVIVVRTFAGDMTLTLQQDHQVTVDMGEPDFAPSSIPFVADREADTYPLEVAGGEVLVTALALGNPHAVQVVDDIEHAPVVEQGRLIERHPRFPERVNAGYMQVLAPDHIKVRVYERGAGETLACGSGACAAVAAGRKRGLLEPVVDVELAGGRLQVQWSGPGERVLMTGPAEKVFEGEIELVDI